MIASVSGSSVSCGVRGTLRHRITGNRIPGGENWYRRSWGLSLVIATPSSR